MVFTVPLLDVGGRLRVALVKRSSVEARADGGGWTLELPRALVTDFEERPETHPTASPARYALDQTIGPDRAFAIDGGAMIIPLHRGFPVHGEAYAAKSYLLFGNATEKVRGANGDGQVVLFNSKCLGRLCVSPRIIYGDPHSSALLIAAAGLIRKLELSRLSLEKRAATPPVPAPAPASAKSGGSEVVALPGTTESARCYLPVSDDSERIKAIKQRAQETTAKEEAAPRATPPYGWFRG